MKTEPNTMENKPDRCQYELWVNEYFGLPDKFPERAISMDFDYGQIVNMLAMFDEKRNAWHKQNLENVMHERDLELAQLKSAGGSVAAPKEEELCPTCGNGWSFNNGMYCSNPWHLATPKIQKQITGLQSELASLRDQLREKDERIKEMYTKEQVTTMLTGFGVAMVLRPHSDVSEKAKQYISDYNKISDSLIKKSQKL